MSFIRYLLIIVGRLIHYLLINNLNFCYSCLRYPDLTKICWDYLNPDKKSIFNIFRTINIFVISLMCINDVPKIHLNLRSR